MSSPTPILDIKGATLRLGGRTIWQQLNLQVKPGEFLAVLGPNGAGKSSLLKTILGLNRLQAGAVHAPHRHAIGYVPQQKAFDRDLPLRGRDLVRLGVDGERWGFGSEAPFKQVIDKTIREVGATKYANKPIGLLSGGEQQRLRIAQALVGNPELLLCDEPLLSLDLASQQAVAKLISARCQKGTAVVFVTHEINSIMQYVDRVLYIVGGKWRLGAPAEILTSECLTELYGVPVDVIKVRGRIIVVAGDELITTELTNPHHHHEGHE